MNTQSNPVQACCLVVVGAILVTLVLAAAGLLAVLPLFTLRLN